MQDTVVFIGKAQDKTPVFRTAMTREEQRQMIGYVRQVHRYKVRGPRILFGLALGVCAFVVGIPILIGILATLARLLHASVQ